MAAPAARRGLRRGAPPLNGGAATLVPRIVVTTGEPAGVGPDLALLAAGRDWPGELVFAGDPALYVRLTYALTDQVAFEGNGGFVSGDLGSTQLYHGGIVVTPWRGRWVAIGGTIGGGVVHVTPTNLLVNATSGTFPAAHAGVGFTIPLFRNLEARCDVRHFTLFMNTERTREFQEYSAGLSFRF